MDIFKSNIVVGVAAALAATVLVPVLIPVVTAAARPLAKSLLKGGVILYERGREAVAGAGEAMEDMIAEVRSEMETRTGDGGAGAAYAEEGVALSRAGSTQAQSGTDARAEGQEAAPPRQGVNGTQV